jgi:hypothetical protein
MMTICKLQHRPQNEHPDPAAAASASRVVHTFMQIYLIYIRTSQPEQAPHSFILSSKIMHPSLPAIFFSCKF